jgi:CRP-like cAMP-binding protein
MLTDEQQVAALVNLFHQGNKLIYQKGEYIIRPGGTPQGVFYILEGLVKAFDITKYGEENLLIIRKPGEIIGLTWALTGQDRRIIYATMAPTILLQISREQFTDYIRSNPAAALPILDMLVNMYRIHSERIMNLEYRSVRERLVSFLLTTSKRFGKKTPQGMSLGVPLRHLDIASSISATRESVGRELSSLERAGLITTDQSIIILKDLEGLQKIL